MEETDAERLRLQLARAHGHIEALQRQLAELDAADEQRRAEFEVARAEAADARAALKEAHVRVEEWRRQVAEVRERLAEAERQRAQAEQERAAVIAALGRRARKLLVE